MSIESRIERVLGPKWRYFPKRSYFRRNRGSGTRVQWHADADAATIFRVAASAINVWMPLDAVGTDLPSLEIVPRSHTPCALSPCSPAKIAIGRCVRQDD